MSDQYNQPDFSGAADTLAQAQEVMQKRRDELSSKISLLANQRKAYLASTMADLLPTISPAVLENLQQTVAPFVTTSVAEAFRTHRKFLGVFKRTGYTPTLHLLQTRLAAYLDQGKFGNLKRIDEELSELTADRSELDAQIHKALDLLGLMHQAGKQNVQLPPEAKTAIADMARVGRSGPGARVVSPRFASGSYLSATETHTSSSSSDNSDLWMYYLTGLPMSFRTLLISSIDEQRVSEAVARRHAAIDTPAQGSMHDSSSNRFPDAVAPSSETSSMVCTAESAESDMARAAAAAVTATAIATDDRLGLFS